MIKNNKGISIITLIITIIVLVIITSVTVFTGSNMVSNSREKALEDRLKVIYNAIVAHEKDLGYGDTVVEKQITAEEYFIMGLEDYSDENNFTPVYVSKKIHETDPNKRIYNLKTLRKNNSDEWYEMEPIIYDVGYDSINAKVEFDVTKGVNRPQIIGNMIPLNTYVDEDYDIRTEVVHNVYTEDWYDYSFATPKWANMELDNAKYVWIPRFAYKIQDFYLNKDYDTVPSSAISIIFLKETTNYMANDEILPEDYQVHPAFSNDEGELAGIWIAKYQSEDVDLISDAVNKASNMHSSYTDIESHLMKNTEWAAMAYLSFASGGNSRDGNTLNNSYGICDINSPEFVAACLDGDDEKFDIYSYNGTKLTYESNETTKAGDALIATSSGNSENSSWYKGTSILPTADKPYVLRRGDQSFFAYEAYNGTRNNTSYRNVVTILGSESVNNLAQIKVGDYVSYTPNTSAAGVSWRVWNVIGNNIVIMPTSSVGNLRLGSEPTDTTTAEKLEECLNDYNTAVTQIEALCDNYASNSLGVTAADVRSLKVEDLKNERVSSMTNRNGSVTTCTTGDYFGAKYNEVTDQNDISSSFIVASAAYPVKVKQTYHISSTNGWKPLAESSSENFGTLLGSSPAWLPSPCVDCSSSTLVYFRMYYYSGDRVLAYYLFSSNGNTTSSSRGVRPLVTLNGSQLMLNESNPGNGSSSSPWNIVKK